MAGRIGSILRNNDPPKYGYGGPSRSSVPESPVDSLELSGTMNWQSL
ncbi:MAG: hypothetical protein VYC82_06540 [Verrucomicrobiota bacterium]|nr:hypothetical protein [Verrucomicrobiota bacterium]